jgi:hypothetical protein
VLNIFDNRGISCAPLAYEIAEDVEEEDEQQEYGFQTATATPGTQSLNNLVPSSKYNPEFVNYSGNYFIYNVPTLSGFVGNRFPAHCREIEMAAEVKEGDFEKLMSAIQEPWVRDKHYSIQGYTKFKQPANPTRLDEDSMDSHKIPLDAAEGQRQSGQGAR